MSPRTSGWAGSTGGTDTSSPYAAPTAYSWTAGAAAPGAKTVTSTNGTGLTATRNSHGQRRLDRPERADRRTRRRAVVHERVPAPDHRCRHGCRIRGGRRARSRRTGLGGVDERVVRDVRILLRRHPVRRRRHERRHRQLLPLPVQGDGQRRERLDRLGGLVRRQGGHERRRPRRRCSSAASRTRPPPVRPSTTARRAATSRSPPPPATPNPGSPRTRFR